MSKVKIDFVRFNAIDGVELQGWLNNELSDLAVIHVHGMSGNGYENHFLDHLRAMYQQQDISLFTIDTRGRGVVSDFRQGDGWKHAGSCFEIFNESAHDIQGAITYLKTLGKTRFILQGHSLGCAKVINFVLTQDAAEIEKVILIAPTDMTGAANIDPEHQDYLVKAKQLIADNKGQELVGAECWRIKAPISAQTYPTICEAGSSVDIYGEREGGALIGRVSQPMLIVYGTADSVVAEVDGTIEQWLDRTEKIKNSNTRISLINSATHGFEGFEDTLAAAVRTFVS